ncbi:protein-glutamine gamma-glutamyltransferase 2 [Betta splendens]|uniref:Protein-glutamine gamma-glutamyltransferase 2 n=1 Tax=Betta splendens TaxID=158456 RepID=A0A6P7MIU7_BETSP|nr:protein-glutamine gamma-glutamyltransferase 2 [Betta splendens]
MAASVFNHCRISWERWSRLEVGWAWLSINPSAPNHLSLCSRLPTHPHPLCVYTCHRRRAHAEMAADSKASIFKEVDLNTKTNGREHHTSGLCADALVVRRGQPFTVTLRLTQGFDPTVHALTVAAETGEAPSEDRGTRSCFGIPDREGRSPSAKAVWKIELDESSAAAAGVLVLAITPHASAPVGRYTLTVRHGDAQTVLARPAVLFNPWCPDDWVFLPDESERGEYVMNEQGVIFKGSGSYITPVLWDFGQFEDNMVNICLKLLDVNNKHLQNAAEDESARCNPIYVGRVVSAMINCADDRGVLEGNWGSSFRGGVAPSQWTGSYAILRKWFYSDCSPVKYGQCWVFAAVMCSVMRLLGIPCRVVTNYESAHDNDGNLIIDEYHADYGVREKESADSVWNYHVWVEAHMRRPDLAADGTYDGWQVLDPTPQEKSEGAYCCGPASVKAILNGDTNLKYDVPFIYAEVNADCIDWLVKADGSKVNIFSDTKRVGQNISTKAVGSNKRVDITDTYKYPEGTDKEREVYKHATAVNANNEAAKDGEVPPVTLTFEEVSRPVNGQDVSLKLVLRSSGAGARPVSVSISVQGMTYNGRPAVNISSDAKEETLAPGRDTSIPILVPFSTYSKHMVQCDSMKISGLVTDKQKPDDKYLAQRDIVLANPPLDITVSGDIRVNREASVEVAFTNPINELLKNCSLTVSGSGLMQEQRFALPDLQPKKRARAKFQISPYKNGEKTLIANFDCSAFRNIKKSCSVIVKP